MRKGAELFTARKTVLTPFRHPFSPPLFATPFRHAVEKCGFPSSKRYLRASYTIDDEGYQQTFMLSSLHVKRRATSAEAALVTNKDVELIDRFRRYDRAAQVKLIRRWEGPLLQIAYRVVGCLDQAEDIRQTIMLRMLQSPESLPAPSALAAWLRRCVVNESVTRARRADVHERATSALRQINPKGHVATSSEQLIANEEIGRLHRALRELEAESRALLSLRFDEDLTFREISEILQRPVSTVKSQVGRAINDLRQILRRKEQKRKEK